jgi:predicted amidohydrolase YtcJ
VKLVLDGSIQGFTATVDWPGYISGDADPLFLVAPEQVVDILRPFHMARIGIHTHCNGNMAADVFIDAIEQLLTEFSWLDHRHTVTHAQLMTPAQMRKAKNLGMCANFFVNHMFYWGDQHHDITVGPDRARALNACATADRIGLPYSFHSDAPVTPPGHLHTMWAAVNRLTPSGRVMGENECISIDRAFHAATIDAAYQMHVDHLVGSLEVGKFADITVLDADPYEVTPDSIRDITVWGTMVGGVIHQNP